MNKVSLQINLAPGDYLHAQHLLKHQLEVLSNQVDEIILTVDTRPAQGRFAHGWKEYKTKFEKFLKAEIQPYFQVKILAVDYSIDAKRKIASFFFGCDNLPENDFRGGPFYAYFFGLYSATNNLVLHLDSDIFLGGGSQTWISEAVKIFDDKSCLIVSPLPGPPHRQDILIGQTVLKKLGPHTFHLAGMSTRIFMINMSIFASAKLSVAKPNLRNQIKAVIEGNSNAELPELILSTFMMKHNLKRIDFLGTANGLWSLHPPYRTKAFYNDLPSLINKIALKDLPERQHGFYDIIDEVCDWSEARENLKHNRWWKRYM